MPPTLQNNHTTAGHPGGRAVPSTQQTVRPTPADAPRAMHGAHAASATLKAGASMPLHFAILGSLEIRTADQNIRITAPKQRAVLAALLLNPNHDVTTDQLIRYTWDHRPPATAQTTIQSYIYRLRQLLKPIPDVTLQTNIDSYALHADPDTIDLHHFHQHICDAGVHAETGELQAAATNLRRALGLWRGNALTGIPGDTITQQATILNNERITAYEELFDTEITLGHARSIISELHKTVANHPYHELFRAQLMHALYASGRQTEALQHYAHFRRRLRDTLGIEPGAELQHLHRAVLNHTAPADITAPARLRTTQIPIC